MPVWSIVEVLKLTIRYGIIIGFFFLLAGFANLLGNAILSLWILVNNGVDDFGRLLNGGSGGSGSSCFLYYIHALGIDVALTSFFVALVGLASVWASTIVAILGYRTTIFAKNLVISGTQ